MCGNCINTSCTCPAGTQLTRCRCSIPYKNYCGSCGHYPVQSLRAADDESATETAADEA